MKNIKRLFFIVVFIIPFQIIAQDEDDGHIKHHHFVVTMGNSLIPAIEEEGNNLILVPTWGISYEYLFNKHVGIGWKNELEFSNYVLEDESGNKITREFPLASSIIFIYNPIEGLGLFVGPGIEFEKEENFYILTIGISYEWELPKYFDISPEFSYELKNGHTGAFSFGLGIGYRVGKN